MFVEKTLVQTAEKMEKTKYSDSWQHGQLWPFSPLYSKLIVQFGFLNLT